MELATAENVMSNIRFDVVTKRGSVLDVVQLVTGCGQGHATETLSGIKARFPDVHGRIVNFKFPGRGQRDTPVATVPVLVEIAWLCPGRNAQEFRRTGAKTLCRALGGDLSLVEEIRKRHSEVAWSDEQAAFLEGTGVSIEDANARRNAELDERERRLKIESSELELYKTLKADAESEGDERIKKALLDRALRVLQIDAPPPSANTPTLPSPPPDSEDAWMRNEIPRKKSAGASPEVVEAFLESGWIQFGSEKYMPYSTFKNMFGAFANEKRYSGPKNLSTESVSLPFRKRGLKVERSHLRYEGKRSVADFLIGADMYRPPEPNYFTRSVSNQKFV